jgi:hypothetical protein
MLPGAEPNWDGASTSESIVQASGKMMMLDRLLPKLKAAGNRVVLFSQFTSMLNIIEDFLVMRGYEYVRLDGSTCRVKRTLDLRVFNAPNRSLSYQHCHIKSEEGGGGGSTGRVFDERVERVEKETDFFPPTPHY